MYGDVGIGKRGISTHKPVIFDDKPEQQESNKDTIIVYNNN